MTMILRIAARSLEALQPVTDETHDSQMAVTHLLLQNGWKSGIGGKVIKQVKGPHQHTPKTYVLDMLRDGHMAVLDRQSGKVLAKVRLKAQMSNSDIMNAAKTLNNGAAKLVMAGEEDA